MNCPVWREIYTFSGAEGFCVSGYRKIGTEALGELYPSKLNADTCTK